MGNLPDEIMPLQQIQNTKLATTTPEPHALDPTVPRLLPLESALVLYTPPQPQNATDVADFDLAKILEDFQNDNNDDILMAASQNISQASTTTMTTAVIKRNSPKIPMPQQTFTNCSFGNIGTLNIHIHKN